MSMENFVTMCVHRTHLLKVIDNRKPFVPATISIAYHFRDKNWIVIKYDVSNTMIGKVHLATIEGLKRRFAHIQESPV